MYGAIAGAASLSLSLSLYLYRSLSLSLPLSLSLSRERERERERVRERARERERERERERKRDSEHTIRNEHECNEMVSRAVGPALQFYISSMSDSLANLRENIILDRRVMEPGLENAQLTNANPHSEGCAFLQVWAF